MAATRLKVDDRELTFASLADFEFCLDARTAVPAHKMMKLTRQPAEILHEEARNIRKVEQRFTNVLARALDEPRSLATSLRELDRQLFSQDYRWRSIMEAVNALPSDNEAFRRTALTRYLLYLRSRQEALRGAYLEQRRRDDTPALVPAEESGGPPSLRETSIFDVEDIPSSEADEDGFATLPRGETVKVRAPASGPLTIMLSGHRFELASGDGLQLIDATGKRHALRGGRNVIGRDLDNDVVIDAGFRDVSRRHVIIEVTGTEWLQMTDLSSHGTRVSVATP